MIYEIILQEKNYFLKTSSCFSAVARSDEGKFCFTVIFTMSSTENLFEDAGKFTSSLESGYKSEGTDNGLPLPKHKSKKSSKKKESRKNVGLENKGFEADTEQTDTSTKHKIQVHRASSENKARKLRTQDKRRHSDAGRISVPDDTTKPSHESAAAQKERGSTRRRSSADEDLRRRACFNSMRLRRVSSSSQLPSYEVDTSVEDEMFYQNLPMTSVENGHQEMTNQERPKDEVFHQNPPMDRIENEYQEVPYRERPRLNKADRVFSMDSLCNSVEQENRKLDEYSMRLSCALEERAKLEQELSILRSNASVARTMSTEESERWKISPGIHYRNEKYNSERRISSRGDLDMQLSIEQLRGMQLEQSRKLPNVPPRVASQRDEEIHERIESVNETKVERLLQRKVSEKLPQQAEGKTKSQNFRLSDPEKTRRERKLADLAADLWKKLSQGEKFSENEVERKVATPDVPMRNENDKDFKTRGDSFYNMGSASETDSEEYYIPELAKEAIPSTSGINSLKKKNAKGNSLMRSESASSLTRTDAFRRKQRRPMRQKRVSTASEPRSGEAKPLKSMEFKDPPTNKHRQEKPEKMEGIRSTEAVSQNHSARFDYMLPPGKRGQGRNPFSQNLQSSPNEPPSGEQPLSVKLRYYQELEQKRSQEENAFDLSDAFMAAEDIEAELKYREKAAGEAAILRREASRLLWQAMNLERICDPNARVRHIFTPY